jgi:hypothetical protein
MKEQTFDDLDNSGTDGCFYCHFEEKKRPARDFSMVYIQSNSKVGGKVTKGKFGDPNFQRYIPRALCNECLRAGRSLATKFDRFGNIKVKYTEFSKFRG